MADANEKRKGKKKIVPTWNFFLSVLGCRIVVASEGGPNFFSLLLITSSS
ncbi:hypothetical protein Fmac_000797 [Flemingia macrophylla]|uniref:Uncharacterized protein n=1 Tax=Flemingia macrophylla TaxID=520843 RepID=A0ABD1NF90_9FABA